VLLGKSAYSSWEEKVQSLGSKGAGLDVMAELNIPVPPGFTLITDACRYYLREERMPPGLEEEVNVHIQEMERVKKEKFGDAKNPLLVSVRSGAPVSMPGMMDTILNLGLNAEITEGLAKKTSNPRFAYDAYRRFLQMMGKIVLHIPGPLFEKEIDRLKARRKTTKDEDLSAEDWQEIASRFEHLIESYTGRKFPDDPYEHLWMAIRAIFESWNNERAKAYRQIYHVPDTLGTAVNVVAMVFGNLGPRSGTGVAFSRDPSTGEKRLYGDFLPNAQGEDVVAGTRTPFPLSRRDLTNGVQFSLEDWMPSAYAELLDISQRLEAHFHEMQDMEFTIEEGKLWLLQTRTGKRTPKATVKIAVDMVHEGLISHQQAILRQKPEDFELLLHPMVDPKYKVKPVATGIPASPGVATGMVVFDWREAERLKKNGESVILVRNETSADDIRGMVAAAGILTTRGGKTSHAAVVARGMGKPAVVGAEQLFIHFEGGFFDAPSVRIRKYDILTIDGGSGAIYPGDVPKVTPTPSPEMEELLQWANSFRTLKVLANAETLQDARAALPVGAEGIGLARTEHMFFGEERITAFRELILLALQERRLREVRDGESTRKAIYAVMERIRKMQKEDFKQLLRLMQGLPVIVRFLDPPLHEFLPTAEDMIQQLAGRLRLDFEFVRSSIENLKEINPMLGHRGVRLAITFPEIYQVQMQALTESACELLKEGVAVHPEVMLPLVGFERELTWIRPRLEEIVKSVSEQQDVPLKIPIGTMIELPRSAMTAGSIARYVDFFSFGTNDLTQTTLGFSRDDSGKFLPDYIQQRVLDFDPFQVLDREGVGKLIQWAIQQGRAVNPNLKIGVCGEHGGDPSSIEFFQQVGVDYVSVSPFRVPVARLAAAIAALKQAGASPESSRTV